MYNPEESENCDFLQLLLLKCLQQNIPDFRIVYHNGDHFGLLLEDGEDTSVIDFRFSLKAHCVEEDFIGKGEFALQKCMENVGSYETSRSITNYFIYTNRPLVKLGFFSQHIGKYNFLSFTSLYHVNLGDDKLNIFIDQVPSNIKTVVNEVFHRLIGQRPINSQVILEQFRLYIKSNLMHHLTKRDIMLTLLYMFISRYKVSLNYTTDCKFSDVWDDIVCDKFLVVVKSNYVNDSFLRNHTASAVVKFGNHSETLYKNLWFKNQIALLLRAQSQSDLSNILDILHMFSVRLKVVILCDQASSRETMCHLSDNQVNALLLNKISLQGKCNMNLHEFLDQSMLQSLSPSDIIRLLTNNFVINGRYDKLPSYFIDRLFFKILLRFDVLQEVQEEVFIVKSTSCDNVILKNLRSYNLPNVFIVEDSETEVIEKAKSRNLPIHFLILKDENCLEWVNSWGSTENIQKFNISEELRITCGVTDLINEKRNVHLLVIDRSMGGSTLLDSIALDIQNEWVVTIQLNQDLCYYENLSGKSALDHLNYFYNLDDSELLQKLLKRFVSMKKVHVLVDGYDKVPLSYLNKVMEMIVCLHKADFNLWVLVTLQNVPGLQNYLNVIPTIVRPFSEQDQKRFLKKYYAELWEFQENIQEFIEKLLKVIPKELESFLKFPLYLRFLGNIFIEELKYSCVWDVLPTEDSFDLLHFMEMFMGEYADWLVGMYGDSIRQFFNECYPLLALQFVFHKNDLKYLEITKKCDNFENQLALVKEGIITEYGLKVNFPQSIMADYLAAKWMYENLRSSNNCIRSINTALYSRRFSDLDCYRGVFKMFDYMLAKNCSLHTGLMKGKFNQVKSVLISQPNCLYMTDAGGRNIVHIAALYGVFHPKLQNNPAISIDDNMLSIISLADLKAIEAEDTLLGWSTLDYALGAGCLAVANAICEKAPHLINNVYLGPSQLESYYEYCMVLNEYKHLYKNLLKYTICLKVATGEITGSSQMGTLAATLNFSEFANENFRNYLSSYNVVVLYHLMENLQLKKENSRYYNQLHLASAFGNKHNILELLKEGAKINNLRSYSCTPLHSAVVHVNINTIEALLSAGAKINMVDVYGNTSLHLACQYTNSSIIKELIAQGADISIQNDDGNTPLHHALKCSQEQNAELFLPKKFYELLLLPETISSSLQCLDINLQNKDGDTPLLLALQHNCLYTASELLKYHADVNISNGSKNTSLHYAVQADDYNIVLELIYSFVNVNAVNEDGETPLLIALKKGHVKIANLLIMKGARVTDSDKRGRSCLHYAATTGVVQLVGTLIEKGADVNQQNDDGETPVAKAVYERRSNIARFLLNKGAKSNSLDKNGDSLLHYTSQCGFRNLTIDLIGAGCDLNVRNVDGETPLIVAMKNDRLTIAMLLLRSGADVTVLDNNGTSCLHLAVRASSLDLLEKCLAMGSDVNQVDDERNTPLLIAAQNEISTRLINKLVESGADTSVEDQHGCSLIHYASKFCIEDIIKKLIEKGDDLNKETLDGDTPLFLHIKSGYNKLSIVKLLIDNGADVNKLHSRSGRSCLHFAAVDSSDVIIKYLLTKDVNINLQKNSGHTALHLAVMACNIEATELLLANGADVTVTDFVSHNTCLHEAIFEGQRNDILKTLIKYGADVNATNNRGETPIFLAERLGYADIIKILIRPNSATTNHLSLFLAVEYGELHTVKQLLSEGLDINSRDADGNTPILLALQYNQVDMIDFLLSQGADITISNHNGTTCLHNAAYGDIQTTRQLLARGSEINAVNANGETALQISIKMRQIHIAQLLLDHKAEIDLIPSSNSMGSCLHCACQNGAYEIVTQILQSGFYIDKLNRYGVTALMDTLIQKQQQVAISLIEHGADVNLEIDSGVSCFWYACVNQFLGMINFVVDKGVVLNKAKSSCNTFLADAISSKKRATAMLLISKGFDVNTPSYSGDYALHLAAAAGMDDIINKILNQGFDINKRNEAGETGLYNALRNRHFGTTHMIRSKGADISDFRYLHLAVDSGYEDFVTELIKSGVDIHRENTNLQTPIQIALSGGQVNIIKLLFERIITENYRDDDFNYLHLASQFGDNKVITSLLNMGYDINKQNDDGETPLLVALRNKNYQTARLLLSKGADYINTEVPERNSYLNYFSELGWDDMLLNILQSGFNVNARTYDYETALRIASKHRNISTIKLLLSNGADLSSLDDFGRSPLNFAVERGSKSDLKTILENIEISKEHIMPAISECLDRNNYKLMKILVNNINILEHDLDQTVLERCVINQWHDLVTELLNRNGNVNHLNSDGHTLILTALSKRDEKMIRLLLEHCADIYVTSKEGNSCLHYAVCNSPEILELFLEKGCDLDLKNIHGLTPLLFGLDIEKEYTNSLQLLIRHGANIHTEDLNGNNCLHYAARIGADDLLEYLIENGVDANKKNNDGDDCLDLAIDGEHVNVLKLLINRGMDPNRVSRSGETCLLKAVHDNDDEFVEELLDMGVDVNFQSNTGNTAFTTALMNSNTSCAIILLDKNADVLLRKTSSNLHLAISQKVDIVEQLLDLGLGIDEQDDKGYTPLLLALQAGSADHVRLLLKKGANIHIRDNKGNCCLYFAVECLGKDVLEDLIIRGADVNKRNMLGETPLLRALRKKRLAHAKILLKYGSSVNVYDNEGNTCLLYAAKHGLNDFVMDFISKGVDVNYESCKGVSPFLAALENKHTIAVELLIENGADIYSQTDRNMCWLDYVTNCGKKKINHTIAIIDLLLTKGADINYRSAQCEPMLLCALENQHRTMANFLIKKGANVHLTCYKSGSSCLHYASAAGYDDLVTDLLDKGLDIDRENNDRETPLRLAFYKRRCSTIQLLLSRGASVDDGNFIDTYMHYAVQIGDGLIVQELVNKGADLNRLNHKRKTPAMIAFETQNMTIVKLLQENGVTFSSGLSE